MSKHLFLIAILVSLGFLGMCESFSVSFNITVGGQYSWQTDSFTKIYYNFLTANTSGVATYSDLSDSKIFESYSIPPTLNGYELLGVFQLDLQKASIPSNDASFSFTHDFSFGILNVNPKELCIVGVDMEKKTFVPIDFTKGSEQFTQQVIFPLQTKVYTIAIMGIESEIPAQFGVSTLVNYRASLKYEIHKNLNQYLSAFVNRPLTYPSHEYVAQLVSNQIALPSSQMIEIVSFSFSPMFPPTYQGRMVVRDFMFSFDLTKGFVDKTGKSVDIDFQSLQCLYIVDEKQGFVQKYGSAVFPGWQKLACTPEIGENDFYPKYITIVGTLKSNPPNPNPNSIHSTTPHNNGTSSLSIPLLVILVIFFVFTVNMI